MQLSKPYSEKFRMLLHVAASHSEFNILFTQRAEIKRVGYIIVTSDRGLCGGLNVNLFRQVVADMRSSVITRSKSIYV